MFIKVIGAHADEHFGASNRDFRGWRANQHFQLEFHTGTQHPVTRIPPVGLSTPSLPPLSLLSVLGEMCLIICM